jgi:DNA repair exonuclease SbcCD ATPase subunit
MKVISVKIENYGAFYGEHWFSYADRGLTMVLGENLDEPRMNSNGSAKSTLFECLDWCLYGKVPKGDHADSVINEEAKGCSVTVLLEDDDGTPGAIQRLRPSALKFWLNSEELTFLDTSKTQEAIEKWLGMDRDVFHASVFFAQTDLMHFADVGDAKRVELLSKIIPEMSVVDELLEKAKAARTKAELSLSEAQTDLTRAEGQLQGLEGINYKEKQASWETQRQTDIATVTARMDELRKYILEHEEDAKGLLILEAEATKLAAQPAIPKPEGSMLWDADQKVIQAHSTHGVFQAEVTRLRNAIQKITTTATGECSQCGQQITKDHLERETSSLQAQMQEAVRKAEAAHQVWLDLQAQLVEMKNAQERAETEWRDAEAFRARALNDVNQQVTALRQLNVYLDNARREVSDCGTKLHTLDVAVNPFLEEEQKLEKKRDELRWSIEGASHAVEERSTTIQYLEFWVKAFGPRGLKNYILDSKLQEMTDAANHWVKLLTGGTFWIRFETQKKGRSTNKLSNEFNIRIFRYNPDGRISDRNYKSWSGGEKGRVSLAIDIGLSRLIANRAAKSYDILILDELFKHVDQAGGEAIAEMLEELRREKSSLFVIEHDNDFQSRFENQVLVRRKNARSAIVELTNDREEDSSGERQADPSNRQAAPRNQRPTTKTNRKKKKPKRKAVRRRVSG